MTDLKASVILADAGITSIPALAEVSDETLCLPLSQALRKATERSHRQVELRLALPGSIRDLADYRAYLLRFYQLYRPIEVLFQGFPDWPAAGLDPAGCCLSVRLAADLQALAVSVPDIPCAPSASLPPLPDFASALGACYVMEGSALGSQFMLPHIQQAVGNLMDGADSFFRGRGIETGPYWKRFRAALDLYGDTFPEQKASVVSGAIATFETIGLWMRP